MQMKKIPDDIVELIRQAEGSYSQIADRHNVSTSSVARIKQGWGRTKKISESELLLMTNQDMETAANGHRPIYAGVAR